MSDHDRELSPEALIEYLLELGGHLLAYGCPTHRLEALVRQIAALEGHHGDAFATPTGLLISITGRGSPPLLRMVRVRDWAVDLGRLAALDKVLNDVLYRRLTLAEARLRMRQIVSRTSGPARKLADTLAAACACGAAAVFFRGGSGEILWAALGGLLAGLVRLLLGKSARARLLSDFLSAVASTTVAVVASTLDPTLSRDVLVLAGVILLVPGMALTTGFAELAHKNLVSGGAKLMEALVAFLSIVMGVAVVFGAETLSGRAAPAPVAVYAQPALVQALAVAVASLCFCVLFSVPRGKLAIPAFLSGAVSYAVTALGSGRVPSPMVAFSGALAVALYANAVARVTDRPAQVFLVPGLILLVPGSFGFLSLESFLRGEFLGGAQRGFDMFLAAGGIVVGLLVANVVLPARKIL